MTAATPGQADEPGLFGEGLEPSPEAEAEAVPVSLGRIAHDGFYTARDSSPEACAANWNTGRPLFHTWWQGAGRAVADHLAAQEPHAAAGLAEVVGALREALGDDRDAEPEKGEAPGKHAVRLAHYLSERIDELHGLIASAEPQPAPELAAERDGLRKALRAISLGIAEPSPKTVADNALDGRYFDPDTDAGVWSMSDPAEQVRLARQDRDQLRTAVLSLAAELDQSAARTAPSKKSSIESEIAIHLRKTAEPPA